MENVKNTPMTVIKNEEHKEVNVPLSKQEQKKLQKSAKEIIRMKEIAEQRFNSLQEQNKIAIKKLRYQLLLIRVQGNPGTENKSIIEDIKKVEKYMTESYATVTIDTSNEELQIIADMSDLKFNVLKQYISSRPAKSMDELLEEAKETIEYLIS